MRTGGAAGSGPPTAAPHPPNGHALKLNGHPNGGARWSNGHAKHEDKHSTLSRYWTGSVGAEGRLWEDPDFPPTNRALYRHKKLTTQPVVWMRPHELCTRPVFRAEMEAREGSADGGAEGSALSRSHSIETGATNASLATRLGVETGEVGDPALLVGVSALALTPRLLERVVPSGQDFQNNYCGAFRFRFWQFGEWRQVTVDDRLPAHRGRLMCSRHTSATDFWIPLLEKAYAKLYGSYENLSRGSVSRVLQDLTGGIVQSFSLQSQDRYLTFQLLNSAVPRSTLLVATVHHEKEKRQIRLRNGLMSGQAYCVTGLARVRGTGGDTPLVRLRNPAARGEWTGAWSRASWEWHGLSDRDKELLSVRVTHDGEFWMSFEDFARCFTRLELVHVGPDDWMSEPALHAKRPWRAVLARRRWRTGYNAGGGPQYPETTAMNPQFHIQIPRASAAKCHVVVAVAQQLSARLQAIGFAVYEVPPQAPRLTPHGVQDQRPLDVTNHSVAREVVTFFTLPPGDYVVVPQTSTPNVDANFLLRILTDEQTNIWEVNEDNLLLRNIPAEFAEDHQLIPLDIRASIDRILEKRKIQEVDVAGLCRVLRGCWRWAVGRRPSGELSRLLLVWSDSDISGRLSRQRLYTLLAVLRVWNTTFSSTPSRCGAAGRTSSYRLRGLLSAAGVTVSNKVLECLVLRFTREAAISVDAYIMAMACLHLAHERYHSLDTKMKTNPLSLEEMILMTIYS